MNAARRPAPALFGRVARVARRASARGCRSLVVCGALVAWSGSGRCASAEGARVALVRPTAPNGPAREALTRIQGELAAEGFDVVIVDSPLPPETPSGAGLSDRGALASIEFAVDADNRGAELRVVDRLTSKTVIRRTAIDAPVSVGGGLGARVGAGSRFAEVLAVRAVELLRASLVELLIRSHQPPAAAATPAVRAATEHAAKWVASGLDLKWQPTWGVDAGMAVLVGLDGIGPALLGVLRIRVALGRSFQLRATLAGLGTSPRVEDASGGASVGQALGLAEFVATPWSDAVVHPTVSLGAGPLYVSVDGQAVSPSSYVGRQSSGWSVAVDAGAGFVVRLSQHFDISLEAHGFITRPYQVTQFVGQPGARVSQPSLLGALTIVGWL